jgi:hypothetical protein
MIGLMSCRLDNRQPRQPLKELPDARKIPYGWREEKGGCKALRRREGTAFTVRADPVSSPGYRPFLVEYWIFAAE